MIFIRRQFLRLKLRSRIVFITFLTKRVYIEKLFKESDYLNKSTDSDRFKELKIEKNDGDVKYL